MKEKFLWIGVIGIIIFVLVASFKLTILINEFCVVECAYMTDKLIELNELANLTYNQSEWNDFYYECREACFKRLWW